MIAFYLDSTSGLVPYLQLAQQVKHALRLGQLQVGDRLPTVKEVVAEIAVNPNTVFKAYNQLEHEGLVASRPGQGTFVTRSLAQPSLRDQAVLRQRLVAWLRDAHTAGWDEDSIVALLTTTLRAVAKEGVA